jgi:hypothetical protein
MSDTAGINLEEWYTAKQAAEKLGTSTKYVRVLAVQYKKFKTHKMHEHVMLYWKADVDAYRLERGKPGRRARARHMKGCVTILS